MVVPETICRIQTTWKHYSEYGNTLAFLNVGTGIDLTIKDLSEAIAKAAGFVGAIDWDLTKPDGTPKKLLDISIAKKFGWKPKIKLEKGILMAYKSFIKSC
mgnify:CR=1 FL=1